MPLSALLFLRLPLRLSSPRGEGPGGPGWQAVDERSLPGWGGVGIHLGAGGSPGFSEIRKLGAGLGGPGRKGAEAVKSGASRSTRGGQWKSPQEDARRLRGGRAPPATFLLMDSKVRIKPGAALGSLAARLPPGAQPGSSGRERAALRGGGGFAVFS